MSHMVIYRGADGKPGYQQAEDIHDAVTFVEQMRNEEGVEHARIFRLEEVVFEYRPYYRVELHSGGVGSTLGNGMPTTLDRELGVPMAVPSALPAETRDEPSIATPSSAFAGRSIRRTAGKITSGRASLLSSGCCHGALGPYRATSP